MNTKIEDVTRLLCNKGYINWVEEVAILSGDKKVVEQVYERLDAARAKWAKHANAALEPIVTLITRYEEYESALLELL